MNNTKHTAMLTAIELKESLRQLKTGEKEWEAEQKGLLIGSMLEHIGSTDYTLRDDYIYGTFCKLALEKKLDQSLLSELLEKCLTDNMLFKGIGEVESDLVFTRSFTTLLIAVILYTDNESNFLSEEKIKEVKENMILYMEAEKDLRGYVPEKGWAHSIAHAADVFDELAKNRYADKEMFATLLSTLWKRVFVSESVYLHDEEERILLPITEMLKRGLAPAIVSNLLEELPAETAKQKDRLPEEQYWFLIANVKKFLKSFYIRIDGTPELAELQVDVRKCLADYTYF